MDLYSILSDKDKTLIHNYITTKGVKSNNYIGNEKYLAFWAENKQDMYKLLGEQLIYKIPLETLPEEIRGVVDQEQKKRVTQAFVSSDMYTNFKRELFDKCPKSKGVDFYHLYTTNSLKADYHYFDKKGNPKVLLKGTRFAKAMKFFAKLYDIKVDEKELADFILAQSTLFNSTTKGNLCISIHPLDFMTMSDNANNWSSCMKWLYEDTDSMDRGCYCQGSVEMMNSKRVVCVYIENPAKTYQFKTEVSEELKENYTWNSKAWRELFVVDKNIICSGKGYPYKNTDITKYVLEILKNWAEERLGWEYSDSLKRYDCYENRYFIDTKGMYNDWFNDNTYGYYCYENTKNVGEVMISGPSVCLCCGEEVVDFVRNVDPLMENPCDSCCASKEYCEECDDYYAYENVREEYNDRYEFANNLVCECCKDNLEMHTTCEQVGKAKDYFIRLKSSPDYVLAKFYLEAYSCACCGNPYYVNSYKYSFVNPNVCWHSTSQLNICPECEAKFEQKYNLQSLAKEGILSHEIVKNIESECLFPVDFYWKNIHQYEWFENKITEEEFYRFLVKQHTEVDIEGLYSPEEMTKHLQDENYQPINLLAETP